MKRTIDICKNCENLLILAICVYIILLFDFRYMADMDFSNLRKITVLDQDGCRVDVRFVIADKANNVFNAIKNNSLDGLRLRAYEDYTIFMSKVYLSFDGCLEQGDCLRYEEFVA